MFSKLGVAEVFSTLTDILLYRPNNIYVRITIATIADTPINFEQYSFQHEYS